MASKLRPGDIIEIQAPWGYGYIAYAGDDKLLGDGIYVSPHPFSERQVPSDSLFVNAWFTFYPLFAAVRDPDHSIVGQLVKHLPWPRRFRYMGAIGRDGRVHTWIVKGRWRRKVTEKLTPAEQLLPIAQIVMLPTLLDMIATGWRPEHEIGEPPVPMTKQPSDDRRVGEAQHYAYFPHRRDAEACEKELVSLGYVVELRRSEPDGNWLVLARTRDDFDKAAAEVEAIAKRYGGEYDGRQVRVA